MVKFHFRNIPNNTGGMQILFIRHGESEADILSVHERIAIVAHGGVMNSILRAFLKMPINMDYYFKTGDTGISLIELRDKERIIHFINDAGHLAGI